MFIGVPIVIEKRLKVDRAASLSGFCPKEFTTHLDLHPHLGCQRNTSIQIYPSLSVRSGEAKVIRALGWYPGSVVFSLHFQLLIF